MKRKLVILSLLTFGLSFGIVGCGTNVEQPAGGVSIENAEDQTLGFTYLYDLGNGYKLYADNFTKIVYLRYDYQGGKGATAIGSSSMTPYISPNGKYYKVNTNTRVIEEFSPIDNIDETNTENSQENGENTETTQEGENSSTSQKQDIEDILNENSQKNQNNNENSNPSQNPEDNIEPVEQDDNDKAIATPIEDTQSIEDTQNN